MIVITLFVECLSPNAGHSYCDWDHGFSAIGESERGLSRRGSCRGSVGPQDVRQFLRPGTLCFVQFGFDDLEQCPIRHLRLSVHLGRRISSWCRDLNRNPWNLDYRTAVHCPILSSLGSRICRLHSSIQSFKFLLQRLLLKPLLQPIFWSNQYQLVEILPDLYLGVVGRRCRFPITQMATGRLSSSSSLLEASGRSWTVGTCHTSWLALARPPT